MSPLSQSRKWGDACDQCTNPTGTATVNSNVTSGFTNSAVNDTRWKK